MLDRVRLRALARDASLLFCAALATFLVGAWLAARVAPWLANALGHSGPVLRVAVGVLALDLVRAPGLAGAAWLIGPALTTRRGTVAAAALVLLSYGFDAVVAALLQQLAWLWAQPSVLLCRGAAMALMIWLTALVLRRRLPAAATAATQDPS